MNMAEDKYAAERGEPSAAQCSSYTLLFDAYYLKLQLGEGVIQAWHARSGKKVGGLFDYTAARQAVKDEGPIPEGEYWIQPKQLTGAWFGTDGWGITGSRFIRDQRPSHMGEAGSLSTAGRSLEALVVSILRGE
ncbi:hypothetical protein [Sorangium sp. So ce1000]|uniref:hypothetical protein n=1 Tax=Sorangium sp. So ce1000 TaxID=3133325 RepID=UPI003F5FC2C9